MLVSASVYRFANNWFNLKIFVFRPEILCICGNHSTIFFVVCRKPIETINCTNNFTLITHSPVSARYTYIYRRQFVYDLCLLRLIALTSSCKLWIRFETNVQHKLRNCPKCRNTMQICNFIEELHHFFESH